MRYWRTIAVDFAGKQRDDDHKWGLRNAKLRTSRKLLFAGGLCPSCAATVRAGRTTGFLRRCSRPATDRVADAFLGAGLFDAGVRAWAPTTLARPDRPADIRAELDALTFETRETSILHAEIRQLGRTFRTGWALLFASTLGRSTREYAIF